MKTENEQLANRLHLIGRDIQEAHGYLLAYQELSALPEADRLRGHPDLLMACMSAAIVAYSRGFVRSNSTGQATSKFDFNSLDTAKYEWAATLHKRVIAKRNQAVAHSDWVEHNTKLDSTSRSGGAARSSSVPQILSEIHVDKFLELTHVLFQEVSFKCHLLDLRTLSNIQQTSS